MELWQNRGGRTQPRDPGLGAGTKNWGCCFLRRDQEAIQVLFRDVCPRWAAKASNSGHLFRFHPCLRNVPPCKLCHMGGTMMAAGGGLGDCSRSDARGTS